MFDISQFLDGQANKTRYQKQIDRLSGSDIIIDRFQKVTDRAIKNIHNGIRSFCIYGDPQSGKTEMMIVLTAKLLDKGQKIVIILINDDVNLLNQNSKRFSMSDLDPTPKIYLEIIDPNVNIGDQEWVIFCKKKFKRFAKIN